MKVELAQNPSGCNIQRILERSCHQASPRPVIRTIEGLLEYSRLRGVGGLFENVPHLRPRIRLDTYPL